MDPKEVARRLEEIRKTVQQQLAMSEPAELGVDSPEVAPPELPAGVGLILQGEPNLTATPELEEANRAAAILAAGIPPSRVPVLGPLLTALRWVTRPLVRVFLGHYLARQEHFNAQVIRHLNETGRRLETRVRELEETLIEWSANPGGIESRLQIALHDYDAALRQRHMVLFSSLNDEMVALQNLARDVASRHSEDLVELSKKLDVRFDEKYLTVREHLEREIRTSLDRMESTSAELLNMRVLLRQAIRTAGEASPQSAARVERGGRVAPESAAAAPGSSEGPVAEPALSLPGWEGLETWIEDEDYRSFQASFRGDPEEITQRFREHVARFEGVNGPVADLGCGRGEFLDLLAEAGHRAIGVELNAANVEECKQRGHEAVVADLFDWLTAQAAESLGGLFLAQVIEHLPPPRWQELVDLAATRLEPGGKLVVETINPESLYAMARSYVADPTHIRPVHPGLLEFLARRAGLHPVEIELQAPVPADERPATLTVEPPGDEPSLQRLTESIQELIDRVDRLCCAPQEYTLSATRPGRVDEGSA